MILLMELSIGYKSAALLIDLQKGFSDIPYSFSAGLSHKPEKLSSLVS
jgi:hypothetical protein